MCNSLPQLRLFGIIKAVHVAQIAGNPAQSGNRRLLFAGNNQLIPFNGDINCSQNLATILPQRFLFG
jgi:hypothetical protein